MKTYKWNSTNSSGTELKKKNSEVEMLNFCAHLSVDQFPKII
jgi:hypothetical protein